MARSRRELSRHRARCATVPVQRNSSRGCRADTTRYLEEGGGNLSGGQRQRLAIARALLINPPVLVLDEATSALDAESEAIVNANLKRMAKGRTVISISHRLSMLVEADAILVLERGKVYDLGTHEELLRALRHLQAHVVPTESAPRSGKGRGLSDDGHGGNR